MSVRVLISMTITGSNENDDLVPSWPCIISSHNDDWHSLTDKRERERSATWTGLTINRRARATDSGNNNASAFVLSCSVDDHVIILAAHPLPSMFYEENDVCEGCTPLSSMGYLMSFTKEEEEEGFYCIILGSHHNHVLSPVNALFFVFIFTDLKLGNNNRFFFCNSSWLFQINQFYD